MCGCVDVIMSDIVELKSLDEKITKIQFGAQIRADGFENPQKILADMLSKKKLKTLIL